MDTLSQSSLNNWPYPEPLERDEEGDIKTIDKAHKWEGWIEMLEILKRNYGDIHVHFQGEHDEIFLPVDYDPVDPDCEDGHRLQQLGCIWDDENEWWFRFG